MSKQPKVYTGDKALEKMGLLNKLPDKIADSEMSKLREDLLTMRRHFTGGLIAVDRILTAYKPKCEKCYHNYGYITKCICDLERKAGIEDLT